MHPSLTDEAQAEKRREYDRYERAERQRISKHIGGACGRGKRNGRDCRRAAKKSGNRQRNMERRRGR